MLQRSFVTVLYNCLQIPHLTCCFCFLVCCFVVILVVVISVVAVVSVVVVAVHLGAVTHLGDGLAGVMKH